MLIAVQGAGYFKGRAKVSEITFCYSHIHDLAAVDGQDAIEKYQKNQEQIQLLILDVIMPRKNGKDVYNAVRGINPAIKVLFISGYTADIIQGRGMLDEGVPFLSKPVSPKEILLHVTAILNGQGQASGSPDDFPRTSFFGNFLDLSLRNNRV